MSPCTVSSNMTSGHASAREHAIMVKIGILLGIGMLSCGSAPLASA